MIRRKAEKQIVELSLNDVRLMWEALLAFRNKLLSAGKPTEDVNGLIIKVIRWAIMEKMIPVRTANYTRADCTAIGHELKVRYIVTITI